MQDLHLVGFTTDRRHLIFSTRRGSKSGSFVVPVDDELRAAVEDLANDPARADDDPVEEEIVAPPPPRVEAKLSVREVQARLRAGETVGDVAADAGVAEDWVERFAPPVRAEQRQIVARALDRPMERARAGESAKPLGVAVASAMAERGVTFTSDGFADAWTSRLVGQDHWIVEFHFTQRGRRRTVGWTFDVAEGRITTSDRTASQIGFVAPPPTESKDTARPTSSATPADAEGREPGERSTRGDGRPDSVLSTAVADKAVSTRKKPPAKKPAPQKKSAAKKKPARKRTAAPKKKPARKKAAAPKKTTAPKKKVPPATKVAVPEKVAPAKKTAAPKTTSVQEDTPAPNESAVSVDASPPTEPTPPPVEPAPTSTDDAPPEAAGDAGDDVVDPPAMQPPAPESEPVTAPTPSAPDAGSERSDIDPPDNRIRVRRPELTDHGRPTAAFRTGTAVQAGASAAAGRATSPTAQASEPPPGRADTDTDDDAGLDTGTDTDTGTDSGADTGTDTGADDERRAGNGRRPRRVRQLRAR